MDLDKELAQAELNHKSKYEIRKRYLEAELAAAQGNEDAIAQIQLEMAENEEALWEERIEKLREYAEIASGFANAFNDLASALGERRVQEVEEQYSREEQALANMCCNPRISILGMPSFLASRRTPLDSFIRLSLSFVFPSHYRRYVVQIQTKDCGPLNFQTGGHVK